MWSGIYYKEDLWTPIKFHYKTEWLEKYIKKDNTPSKKEWKI